MAVYASGDIVSTTIARSQQWEPHVTAALLADALLTESDVSQRTDVVDVGANVGWFSFAAAANGLTVAAFEPFRQNVNLMKLTACLNPSIAPRVRLHALGLGNETRTCYLMSETSINLGDGHTVCQPPHNVSALPAGYQIIGETAVRLLDDILDQTKVTVFKMDTEGYELYVLKGATTLFSSPRAPRVLFMEFFPRLMRDRNSDPVEALVFLRRHGYTCDKIPAGADLEAYTRSLGMDAVDLRCVKAFTV
jgi:FkbM family methyltransferase